MTNRQVGIPSPLCKINGSNTVYFLALNSNKKQTGGLGALLSACFKQL